MYYDDLISPFPLLFAKHLKSSPYLIVSLLLGTQGFMFPLVLLLRLVNAHLHLKCSLLLNLFHPLASKMPLSPDLTLLSQLSLPRHLSFFSLHTSGFHLSSLLSLSCCLCLGDCVYFLASISICMLILQTVSSPPFPPKINMCFQEFLEQFIFHKLALLNNYLSLPG